MAPSDLRGYADLVRVGAALELLHVFALIHDDVMDASETRRGQAAVHVSARRQHIRLNGLGDPRRYGENIAILAGDLAHSEAGLLMAGTAAPDAGTVANPGHRADDGAGPRPGRGSQRTT